MRSQRRLLSRLLVLAAILIWTLFPLYWAAKTSLTTQRSAASAPATYLPRPLVLANYKALLGIGAAATSSSSGLGRTMLNSIIEAGGAMLVTVPVAVLGAYTLARLKMRFKKAIFGATLLVLALPAYATLIPVYRFFATLHLINTYIGVILVYSSGFLPLALWILYNQFDSIPAELNEAAAIDGASPLRTLYRVIVPVATPGIAAAAIITFLLGWSQFIFPLVLTTDTSTQPVTVLIAALAGQKIVPFTIMMAIGVIAAAPPVVLTLILNRRIVSGLTGGAVK